MTTQAPAMLRPQEEFRSWRFSSVASGHEAFLAAVSEEGAQATFFLQWLSAVRNNGLGHYNAALTAGEHAVRRTENQLWLTTVLPEVVEAAARLGETRRAKDALAHLVIGTDASDTAWATAIQARSEALVCDADPERFYRKALDAFAYTIARVDTARAHLLYGEWLRRGRRRTEARTQLRIAYNELTDLGAVEFADRAHRELLATGETARRRSDETRTDLTPQERLIADLAGDGWTNAEIGVRLFISARTVEWHLRNAFTKLDITSRRALRGSTRGRNASAVAV